MAGFRLDTAARIDREQTIQFFFDGKKLSAYRGDTLASALLANGVSLIGRSFKLHRPRGIIAAGADEPNAILRIESGARTLPNRRATQVEVYDGLIAYSTKGWPSLRFDLAAVNDVFSRLFAAGFYYKTFMRPKFLWRFYEALIRRSAGFSHAPTEADPDDYEHLNAHCDVLVVGAGPAGLIAALTAAMAGARVMLVDEQNEYGGSLLSCSDTVDDGPALVWVEKTVNALAAIENVTLLPRSTAFGYYDHNFVTIAERCTDHLPLAQRHGVRQRLWRVRARQVILAQGALERPLVFSNNDRPGIMLASAVCTYIHRYAVCPGTRAVVFTNNDSAYQAALDLAQCGVSVVIVDSRAEGAAELATQAIASGITILIGHVVIDTRGTRHLSGVKVARWNGDASQHVKSSIMIDCDLLAVSGGWSPAVHLHSQSGGRNHWNDELHCFVPDESPQDCLSVGAANGKWSLGDVLEDGVNAAMCALQRCGLEPPSIVAPAASARTSNPMQALWRVPTETDPECAPKQFVDFQNDTSVTDIRQAVREGYRNVEHVKRYTALGFGTDQGKLGNINGMAILAECLGKSIPEVGTTTFRPCYTPVNFGTIAGEHVADLLDPARKTAIHEWHEAAGAPMEVVGQWHRPWYFPRAGEDQRAAVQRECVATRQSLGIMDASTLGKIDVRGPDAVTFLERIYTHDIANMEVGRCAYGIMLGEDGMLMDDGVMARLGEQHFYLTTTTGGAANVLSWLELWLQTEWPELDVYLTSLTDQLSTIAVVGPNSRRLLQKLGCSISLEPEDFAFMQVCNADLADTPVQLFRVSFSGELAFEINIDSDFALQMWRCVMTAGEEFDITPYGTETMHILRAEKGFLIVGQDTDGSVTPVDAGMNWMLSKNKDYLGKRSLSREDCRREGRKQLVGLLSNDGRTLLQEGAQLVDDPNLPVPTPMCGHVTSSYDSACLGHPIALALVQGGRQRKGETIHAVLSDGTATPVKIVSPVFYDPKSERQHV